MPALDHLLLWVAPNYLTLVLCERLLGLLSAELVTKLYEAAVKKVPLSEEYHSHLFRAYARVGEYKKMQQVGLRLKPLCVCVCLSFYRLFRLIVNPLHASYTGRHGSLQDRPQESVLFLVCNESGDAG